MGKRKSDSRSKLLKKLKKLEKRIGLLSSDSSDEETGNLILSHNMEEDIENVPPDNEFIELSNAQQNDTDVQQKELPEALPHEEMLDTQVLDTQVLDILGVESQPVRVGGELHKQIAQRWNDILKKGLSKEEKDKIEDENPPFSNMKLMVPPLLNPEVSAAINDVSKKRDQMIQRKQKQTSTALTCLGSCLQMCINDNQGHKMDIIKKLNDAAILLCDSINSDTKGRKSLLLPVINKDMKEFLLQSETETHLFGEDLGEKIKTARLVKRSGQELKMAETKKFTTKQSTWVPRTGTPKINNNNKALNWRGPPRADAKKRGGPSPRAPAADRTWGSKKNHPRRK
ncbi:hypothetical protein SFRURICE_010087 [Spodoptera frugiperda]|nr:hypothetical protein SFRURICE_010087 [Spodoptera frugiperda]